MKTEEVARENILQATRPINSTAHPVHVWWVNQDGSYDDERAAGCLLVPKVPRGGIARASRKRLNELMLETASEWHLFVCILVRQMSFAMTTTTFSPEIFWQWLIRHAKCIHAASAPGIILLDHDDLLWQVDLADYEGNRVLGVKLGRGWNAFAILMIFTRKVSHVRLEPTPDGKCLFTCMLKAEKAHKVAGRFMMKHRYEGDENCHKEKLMH